MFNKHVLCQLTSSPLLPLIVPCLVTVPFSLSSPSLLHFQQFRPPQYLTVLEEILLPVVFLFLLQFPVHHILLMLYLPQFEQHLPQQSH